MIVINVIYLNKWSWHYFKLQDTAKSAPLKSLYAVTDSLQYNVGLMYNYTAQPPIWGINEVIFIFTQFSLWCILVWGGGGGSFSIDSFHTCYPISVNTHCGFKAHCHMCDCQPGVCCYMCDYWSGVCWIMHGWWLMAWRFLLHSSLWAYFVYHSWAPQILFETYWTYSSQDLLLFGILFLLRQDKWKHFPFIQFDFVHFTGLSSFSGTALHVQIEFIFIASLVMPADCCLEPLCLNSGGSTMISESAE